MSGFVKTGTPNRGRGRERGGFFPAGFKDGWHGKIMRILSLALLASGRRLQWADMDAVMQSWKLVDTAWQCQPTSFLRMCPAQPAPYQGGGFLLV
jgi:hypothetical protein